MTASVVPASPSALSRSDPSPIVASSRAIVSGLPRRDEEARANLRAVAARARPFVAAGDRRLLVEGMLGELLPAGGVQRGSTVAVEGAPGSGSTTVALAIAAAATSAGEWAAVVDPGGTLGARAAAEVGVELERLAVVRRVPSERWAPVVATLLDGVTVVVAAVPARVRLGDARRLVARARERGVVLVAFGSWPVEAAVRVYTAPGTWHGLGAGTGLLASRDLSVNVEAKGRAGTSARFARAG